jgi:hypothetical protein
MTTNHEQEQPETSSEPQPEKGEPWRVQFRVKTRTYHSYIQQVLFLAVVTLELILFRSRIDDGELLLKLVVTGTIAVLIYRIFTYEPD